MLKGILKTIGFYTITTIFWSPFMSLFGICGMYFNNAISKDEILQVVSGVSGVLLLTTGTILFFVSSDALLVILAISVYMLLTFVILWNFFFPSSPRASKRGVIFIFD